MPRYWVSRWTKCRSVPTDWSNWERMDRYCAKNYLTVDQVMRLIALRRVKAVKFRGRWWVEE